jgi:hypothetical protein
MQFSVPQFIDVEDKIVGPLTAKQTVYLVVGGGFLLLCFSMFEMAFFMVIFAFVAPITLAFAFYRPKGITLARYVGNVLEYFMTDHLYIWRREPEMTMFKTVQKKHAVTAEPIKYVPRSRIRDLANLLDTSTAVNLPYEAQDRPDTNIFGR